jgi:hypothetical protein
MITMHLKNTTPHLFPGEVEELLRQLDGVGFFDDAMLVGSWVMPLYREFFGMSYALRTLDIDFAINIVRGATSPRADLERILTGLGYLPTISQSGIQKFSRENFTVEFITHRKGGRDDGIVLFRNWNLTACPLPFVDILQRFPFQADFGTFSVVAPLPEAYFVHKLIVCQRRRETGKQERDLEQCETISRKIDAERLAKVMEAVKLSKLVIQALRTSCAAIYFPPQALGIS